jgi:hypothetical protein
MVAEFCNLINLPYQQEQGLFAVGFYTSFLKMPTQGISPARPAEDEEGVEINQAPPPGPAEPDAAPGEPWSMPAPTPADPSEVNQPSDNPMPSNG